MKILALTQGLWGERIATHVRTESPDWVVYSWAAPAALPLVIDDPAELLPQSFPESDLLLALGDTPGMAQLVPDVVRLSGARAVIAPIDRNSALPEGLANQLHAWLEAMAVVVVFPKPFCSLTETTYNVPPLVQTYDDPDIRKFAARFGRPEVRLDVSQGRISGVEFLRQSACGCSQAIADEVLGVAVDEAVDAAAMRHHHFPCLASMNIDRDYQDTLMHVSGNIVKRAFRDALGDQIKPRFVRPVGRVG